MTEIEKLGMDYIRPQLDEAYKPYGEVKMMELTRFNGYDMLTAFEEGSKVNDKEPTEIPLYNEQDIIKAIEDEGLVDRAWGYKTPSCIWIYTEGMEKNEIWEKYPTPLHGFEQASWNGNYLEKATYFLLSDYPGAEELKEDIYE